MSGKDPNDVLVDFLSSSRPSNANSQESAAGDSESVQDFADDGYRDGETIESSHEDFAVDEVREFSLEEDGFPVEEVSAKPRLSKAQRKKVIMGLSAAAVLGVVFIVANGPGDVPVDPASQYANIDPMPESAPAEDDGLPMDTSGWRQVGEPEPPQFSNFTDTPGVVPLVNASASPAVFADPDPTPALPSEDGSKASEGSAAEDTLTRQSLQVREIRQIGERLEVVEKSLADTRTDVQGVGKAVQDLNTGVTRMTSRLQESISAQQTIQALSFTQRPDLQLNMIVLPERCHDCVPYARFRYAGKPLSLADGDTFQYFTVNIQGNRVILSNSDATYSYFPE